MAAALLGLAAFVAQGANAAPVDGPTGNNGTVKIHEGAGEPPPEIRNEPHVCTFHLHFFFADPEQAGTWEIQEWSPGDKGQVVLEGTYDTAGDGEDRDPDATAYGLPDGHYKLFWDGDLDTNKHDKMKVFWVECEQAQPVQETPPGEETPSGGEETPPGGEETPPGGPTGTPPGSEEAPPAGGSEAPIGGTESPSGLDLGVGGVVAQGEGADITPPPTDTASVEARRQDNGWPLIALIIATAVAVATLATPARLVRRTTR